MLQPPTTVLSHDSYRLTAKEIEKKGMKLAYERQYNLLDLFLFAFDLFTYEAF